MSCHVAVGHAMTQGATWWWQEHPMFSSHYFPVKASRLPKAKEAAELVVASKQGLAKDLAALAVANQLFAECEDMRTRIQTRVAKFIQNPLLDYQK